MQLIKYHQQGDRIARRTARKEQRYDRRNPNEGVPQPTQQPIFPQVRSVNNVASIMAQPLAQSSGGPTGLLQKRTMAPQEPVYDTFDQQFGQARKAGLKLFNYKGKSFGTQLAETQPAPQSKGVGPRVEMANPPNQWGITIPPLLNLPPSPAPTNHALGGNKSAPGYSANVPLEKTNKPQLKPTQSVPYVGENPWQKTMPRPSQGIPYGENPWKKTIPQQKQKKRSPIVYRQIEQHQ